MAGMHPSAARGGYDGVIALEPHLAVAGKAGGFTGLDLFVEAIEALRGVMRDVGM